MKKLITLTAIALLSTSAFALDDTNKTTATTTRDTTVNSRDNVGMNRDTTKADHDKWWHDRDTNNDGKISRQEYLKDQTKDGKSAAEARKEFDEKDTDKDGYINASEFKAWFEKMGDKVQGTAHKASDTKNDVKRDYKNSDINNNGK